MLKGFKEFIMKGNVVDLAVAVVMGAAFGAVVDSIVKGLLTPLIARLFNAKDLAGMTWEGFAYGSVIAAIINFVLIAAAIYFVVVMPMNHMIARRNAKLGIKEEEEAVDPQIALLTEIRDSLKNR
ncbi:MULTISPECIES: large conductance mechanosensitive channel protein MscL [Arthrobacter]|uniref:Large-conductance mechanosensitive channel n=1 Tax=Arthrobacter woluwensis TaxID=156980 RepID=A0A1H4M7E8_9MICC|nr:MULTISPECIES: large conductance mechanosensitive channel protein MscL [Arthrobacter]PSS43556.1 large conductance mechanosensitive channel protein MscL [Arthrobacter woluwensis]SEB78737.1 large conductance mechanosensitive channel [Arthrobacter woluwensis]